MGEIAWIDAPIVSGSVVVGPLDAVEQRVPHVRVVVRHVDFGAQHAMAIGMDAVPHFLEEAQVLPTGRSRWGLLVPGEVGVLCAAISSAVWWST